MTHIPLHLSMHMSMHMPVHSYSRTADDDAEGTKERKIKVRAFAAKLHKMYKHKSNKQYSELLQVTPLASEFVELFF